MCYNSIAFLQCRLPTPKSDAKWAICSLAGIAGPIIGQKTEALSMTIWREGCS
jgi:hypothetical protein